MSNVNPPQSVYAPRRNSIIDKMLTREKVWSIIAIFSLFGSIEDGFFFPFLIFAIVLYSITERDKSKVRIIQYLKQQPKTSVQQLSKALDKSHKHVITVIKIMVLDEGFPIRLDLGSNAVTKVGRFPGESAPQNAAQAQTKSPVAHTETVQSDFETRTPSSIEPNVSEVQTGSVETGADTIYEEQQKLPKMHCTQCNELLPMNAKFCSGCGVRQL